MVLRVAVIMAVALLAGLQASLSDLKPALQAELNLVAADHPSLALGLGWSGAGVTLGLAAGNVPLPGQPSRPARADDRFLFGSGTKPFTAVAVLRLVEAGALSLSDLVAGHVDEVLGRANGTSVAALYGAEAAAALTVGHLLRMQSGLPDFDTRDLDATILADGRGVWPPYAILRAAAAQSPQLHFAPGTRTEYSSTNYVLAGLVLLAHSPQAGGDWRRLDLFSLAIPPARRAAYANLRFVNDAPISSVATVAGASSFIPGQVTPIWEQSGGVLGWTCGNMAASALDVARFYRDLLVEGVLLRPPSVATMQQFHLLDFGWDKGGIYYGAGLMIEQIEQPVSNHHFAPPDFGQWGAYMGHGGDTYGFLSEQGIIGRLGNASFSVVANTDGLYTIATRTMACRVIAAAAKALLSEEVDLHCEP